MTFKIILAAAAALPLLAQNPAPKAQRVAVVSHGAVPTGYLGVGVVEVDSEIAKSLGLKEERGVQITNVDPESPASRAGLKAGDVILDYNGQRLEGLAQFVRMVSETPANHRAALGVFRNGSTQILNPVIGQRVQQGFAFNFESPSAPFPPMPPMPPAPEITMPDIPSGMLGWQNSMLGYMGEPVDGQLGEFFGVKEGVLVRSVVKQSPAEKAGLKAGDVITKVDGNAVKSPREVSAIVRRRRERKNLSFSITRAHKEITLDLITWNRPQANEAL